MTTHVRLLAILVAVSGLRLSAASAADTSKDTWKGAWKFEIPPPRDEPWLSYYDTRGKTVFRFGCRTHYEIDAVYPGAAPKQDDTEASITIANGKTQMDFAGFTCLLDPGAEGWPPNTTMLNQADLGHPELDKSKWGALEDRFSKCSQSRPSFFNDRYAAARPITALFFFESETTGLMFVRHRCARGFSW